MEPKIIFPLHLSPPQWNETGAVDVDTVWQQAESLAIAPLSLPVAKLIILHADPASGHFFGYTLLNFTSAPGDSQIYVHRNQGVAQARKDGTITLRVSARPPQHASPAAASVLAR